MIVMLIVAILCFTYTIVISIKQYRLFERELALQKIDLLRLRVAKIYVSKQTDYMKSHMSLWVFAEKTYQTLDLLTQEYLKLLGTSKTKMSQHERNNLATQLKMDVKDYMQQQDLNDEERVFIESFIELQLNIMKIKNPELCFKLKLQKLITEIPYNIYYVFFKMSVSLLSMFPGNKKQYVIKIRDHCFTAHKKKGTIQYSKEIMFDNKYNDLLDKLSLDTLNSNII